jgi:hypothetical protein
MIKTPAQHQTDPKKSPGQIKTIGDYIEQVHQQEFPKKKFTFDEWWNKQGYEDSPWYHELQLCWDESRENM